MRMLAERPGYRIRIYGLKTTRGLKLRPNLGSIYSAGLKREDAGNSQDNIVGCAYQEGGLM
jgi:hypothetical protein